MPTSQWLVFEVAAMEEAEFEVAAKELNMDVGGGCFYVTRLAFNHLLPHLELAECLVSQGHFTTLVSAPALIVTMTLLTANFHQPSHEFTFGVGMNFISYPLV
jgi:hypothetical protein